MSNYSLERTDPTFLTGQVRKSDVVWINYKDEKLKDFECYRINTPDGFKRELKCMDEIAAVFITGGGDWDDDCHNLEYTLYCDLFHKGKYLYSLRRNGYRNSSIFHFEFVKVGDEVRIIFNLRHGQLSVLDALTGKELHSEAKSDKFFTKLIRDGHVLLMDGWIWQPIGIIQLYDISKLATTPNYKPIEISFDTDDDEEPTAKYSIYEDKLFEVNINTRKRMGNAVDLNALLKSLEEN
jgi:hypothetical protein